MGWFNYFNKEVEYVSTMFYLLSSGTFREKLNSTTMRDVNYDLIYIFIKNKKVVNIFT